MPVINRISLYSQVFILETPETPRRCLVTLQQKPDIPPPDSGPWGWLCPGVQTAKPHQSHFPKKEVRTCAWDLGHGTFLNTHRLIHFDVIEDLGANGFNIQVIFLASTSTTNSISCPHAYCSFVAIVTVFPYSFYRLSLHLTPFWFAFFIIPSDLVMLFQGSNQNTIWHLILALDIDSDFVIVGFSSSTYRFIVVDFNTESSTLHQRV